MRNRNLLLKWFSFLLLLVIFGADDALASFVPVEKKIPNPGSGHPLYRMGYSVAIDGDTMVTGAPFSRSDYFTSPGVARVYSRDASGKWKMQQELLASPLKHNIYLGTAVSISGDTIAVGGFGEDEIGGAVYVFTRSEGKWSQQARLVASDRAQNDQFGSAVSIHGDLIVVGAPYKETESVYVGAAYVYRRTTENWEEQVKLSPPEGQIHLFGSCVSTYNGKVAVSGRSRTVVYTEDSEGWQVEADILRGFFNSGSLSLSADTLLIGSSGCIFFYTWNGTEWTQKLSEYQRTIGSSVAICGDTAIAGAPGSLNSEIQAGAVHIYTRSDGIWKKQGYVQANDAAPADSFGESVALTAGTMVVGAEEDSTAEWHSGATYVLTEVNGVWQQKNKFTALNAAACDYFGGSVAINGKMAFIGVAGDNDLGLRTGSVFVYSHNGSGYTQYKRIKLSDGKIDDYFGARIDVSADTLIVSAPGRNAGVGAAYVYKGTATGWILQGELIAPNLTTHDQYASNVAISGNTAVVSAHGDNLYTGAVYVFIRKSGVWSLQGKLVPENGSRGLGFGKSLALDGDRLVVGAPSAGVGYVYVYTRQSGSGGGASAGWSESRLSATNLAYNDCFGSAVDICGDHILVGAYYDDNPTPNSGSAYVFTRNGSTYSQTAILHPAVPSKQFGISVALDGDTALIGANADSEKGSQSGAVYFFKRKGNVWSEQAKVTASDGTAYDSFGSSVAIYQLRALVGASQKSDSALHSGSAYLYLLPTSVQTWTKY